MKAKLIDLITAAESGALQRIYTQAIPIATAFRLSKLIKSVNTELEHYHAERIKLCQKYGMMNEARNQYDIAPENQAEFDHELGELRQVEVELSGEKIVLDMFGKAEIKTTIIGTLEWMIE